jgi:hypothetical protein
MDTTNEQHGQILDEAVRLDNDAYMNEVEAEKLETEAKRLRDVAKEKRDQAGNARKRAEESVSTKKATK